MKKSTDNKNAEAGGVASSALLEELLSAWEDLQKYGTHDGECTFGPPCPACGTPSGRCEKHSEAMTRRVGRMDSAIKSFSSSNEIGLSRHVENLNL